MSRSLSWQVRLLTQALDLLQAPVLLFDRLGRVVYANSAVSDWLTRDPASAPLRTEIAEFARHVAQQLLPPMSAADESPHPVLTACVGGRGRRRLHLYGGCIAITDCDLDRLVLVTLREQVSTPFQNQVWVSFQLTMQECRVAHLLAGRRSNVEIARELRISPHTARHHTESVLAKLGVHSRGDVAGLVDLARAMDG